MILSRANLLTVQLASKDVFERGLNSVRLEPDGSMVAGNGRSIMAVGPADEKKARFPESAAQQMDPPPDGLVFETETIEKVLSHIPKGRKELQYVALSAVVDKHRVGFTSINERNDPTTYAALPKPVKYPNWREAFRNIWSRPRIRVCVNRKDLIDLLKAMESACPDKGGINPIFLEIDQDGGSIVARCKNWETDQHALGAINAYDTKGQWLEHDEWESSILHEKPKAVRKIKCVTPSA